MGVYSVVKESTSIENNDVIEKFRNKIICGDVLKTIRGIPDSSVDLVVTSPPYNLKNSTGNGMKDGRGGNGKTPN